MKIKIFCCSDLVILQAKVNEFLKVLGDKQILDVVQSESAGSVTLSIIYLDV